jgi:ubiquinol-cytochrome c reductase iron-sulfur subunit
MEKSDPEETSLPPLKPENTRRDFIVLAAEGMAVVGGTCVAWPLIDSMNPAADVLAAAAPIEVNLASIQSGQNIKVMWRGVPIFIRNRTTQDIADANKVDINNLHDPQTDEQRVKQGHQQWLVVIGVCTHLGCIPIFDTGAYPDGWFCPWHGSQYDSSGRIRSGPAPKNLVVPEYTFLNDSSIRIG